MLPLVAIAGTTPAGQWVGEVKSPAGDEVEIHLTLQKEGNNWTGTLEDPTMGETVVSNLRVTDTRISFTFKPANAPFPLHFSGSYVAGDDRVTGTFSLHGTSRFVKFKRVPGSEAVDVPAGEEPKTPARIRHEYSFAVTGRMSYWLALHVTKDDVYGINDLTRGTINFDGALKWFPMDGFNVLVRYFRGGHDLTDHPDKLAEFAHLGVSENSYIKLDGFEIGIQGFLGNKISPNSRFNPYLTGVIGQVDWALQENGRGSDSLVEGLYAFEGTGLSTGFGIGTEYELGSSLMLEFEWMWRYFLTEDADKWDADTTWSNQHSWNLSAGLTFGF
ncbi:hypothetical protein KDM41_09980 [bacterium]|nr:hypothetical protein [bacterium]